MTLTLTPSARVNFPTIQHLANGLTIVAEQVPVEAVNMNVWFKVGSAYESDAINGMAHFLEHMIFKGTNKLECGEFERQIEARGAITNAATSQDYTQYYITTAPGDFAQLAPLQLDVVFNAGIPDLAFEKERLVVLEEIRRSEDSPQRRTFARAMETCFNSLPYRRPILGPLEVIEALTPQQMRDFHSYWYKPQHTTISVVGNLPVEELINIVSEGVEQTYQSTVDDTLDFLPLSWSNEHPFEEIERREYVDSSLQQARLVMMWRVPGLSDVDDTYPLDIIAAILGQGKVARLFRDLREERGLVTQISASNLTQYLQGVFYISARLPVANLEVVEAEIALHIEKLHQELITETEIARIRTQVANKFIFGNEKPSDRALLYGYYQSLLASVEPAINYPHQIQSINPVQLQSAAQKYLNPEAYGVVVIKPA
ncbi:MAG: insulinase family protein [Gloeocapsa sp. DLM2.Bin57]|nr:MAG: insulinase family protein [Gloeocapsa sp. DLM2.Bin57]